MLSQTSSKAVLRAVLLATLAAAFLLLLGTRVREHDPVPAGTATPAGAAPSAVAASRLHAAASTGSNVAGATVVNPRVARLLAPGSIWTFLPPTPARRAQEWSPMTAAGRRAARGSASLSDQAPEALARLLRAPEYAASVAPVARLYLAAFERLPDYQSFEHYVGERGRGTRLAAIADEVAASPEFIQRYGVLDHAAFVDRIRHNVLGDVQMPPGWRDGWAAQLESGHMTRGEVMIALSESPEFRAVTEHEVFVSMAYAQALQRAPDPADVTRWVDFLDAGNSREAMLAEVLAENGER